MLHNIILNEQQPEENMRNCLLEQMYYNNSYVQLGYGDLISLDDVIPRSALRYMHNVVVQLFEKDHVSPDDSSEGKTIEIL